jgi:hypothetical protein
MPSQRVSSFASPNPLRTSRSSQEIIRERTASQATIQSEPIESTVQQTNAQLDVDTPQSTSVEAAMWVSREQFYEKNGKYVDDSAYVQPARFQVPARPASDHHAPDHAVDSHAADSHAADSHSIDHADEVHEPHGIAFDEPTLENHAPAMNQHEVNAHEPLHANGPRSLMVQEESPPSPFAVPPAEEEPSVDDSPSDQAAQREDIAGDASDRNKPPKVENKQKGLLEDCDTVRSKLVEAKIGAINLDVSPDYGVGPKSKESAIQKRKSFAATAPIRSWYDFQGQMIIEGRLVDLRYDAIEIETMSGSREAIYLRDLSDADRVYVSEAWKLPATCAVSNTTPADRSYTAATVTWRASGLCSKPLYFEDTQLERYGHEHGAFAQPLISTAHFVGNTIFLPYKMGINPPSECKYALGYYRPGNCAPWTIAPLPLSLRGAAIQGSLIGGAAMVLP